MNIRFEWDENKSQSNLRKHGLALEDARAVFSDPFAITTQDRIEAGEYRWQTIGMVNGHLLLLVAHTLGEGEDGNEIVRLISVRRAEPKERKRYEQNYSQHG